MAPGSAALACLPLQVAVWRRRAACPSEKTLRPKMPQNLAVKDPARLRSWLGNILLPFWAGTGFDAAHGTFVEKFEADGRPSREDYTRVRVQARQVFVFAHASRVGLSDDGLQLAQSAFAFLEEHAWDRAHGGWFHRLRLDGLPLERPTACYAHAFGLLARPAPAPSGAYPPGVARGRPPHPQ